MDISNPDSGPDQRVPEALGERVEPGLRRPVDEVGPADPCAGHTQLPSHIEMRTSGGDETIDLDYKVIDGHWTIVHGIFSASERVAILNFKVIADITYSDITFPTTVSDPRLAGTPAPTSSPSP